MLGFHSQIVLCCYLMFMFFTQEDNVHEIILVVIERDSHMSCMPVESKPYRILLNIKHLMTCLEGSPTSLDMTHGYS